VQPTTITWPPPQPPRSRLSY